MPTLESSQTGFFFLFFFYRYFDQMTDGFTSPPKDAVMNTSSFLRVELSTLIGEKSLTLVGLEPATFRLQASTLTSRPLVPPLLARLARPSSNIVNTYFLCHIHSYSYRAIFVMRGQLHVTNGYGIQIIS